MRRWLSILFAAVMLVGIQGEAPASADSGAPEACAMAPGVCGAMGMGGTCACCRPAAAEPCGPRTPRCQTDPGAGLRLDFLEQRRIAEASTDGSHGVSEPAPWPEGLGSQDEDARPRASGPAEAWDEGPPDGGGGRQTLARLRVLRI